MQDPAEPLLPVEPDRPSRPGLWASVAAAGLLLLGLAAYWGLGREGSAPQERPAAGTADPSEARAKGAKPDSKAAQAPPSESGEERQARELYLAAEAFERAQPEDPEKRMLRWREVVTQYPTSPWARKADEKHRAAAASLEALLAREFDGTRQSARTLATAGQFAEGVRTLEAYRATQTRDILKRRADVEIVALENASRLAYNEAASRARDLAAREDFAGALPLFESVARGAIPEVATRCQKAIGQLKEAAAERNRFEATRKGEEARRAFREEAAPRILGLVRARRYDDALSELGSAAGAPANAGIREEIAAERASVADASAFWGAFLTALRSRIGQETPLLLVDGKKLNGRISRLQEDRIVVENGEMTTEAPLDRLHPDLLVGWTLGRTLAAEDGLSYVKAALFFFCEGRDDLARLYLATARELRGPADAAEKTYRGGFLRAAAGIRK